MAQPLVMITVCFAIGIALAEVGKVPPYLSGSLALIFVLGLVFCLKSRERGLFIFSRGTAEAEASSSAERPGAGRVFFICACATSLALGGFWLGLAKLDVSRLVVFDDHHVDLVGTVVSEGRVYPDREVYVLEVSVLGPQEGDQRVGEKVMLTLTPETGLDRAELSDYADPAGQAYLKKPSLGYGDVISLTGKVQRPREARNPGEFDYRQYLARQGIGVQVVGSRAEVKTLASGSGFFLRRWALTVRSRVEDVMRRALPARQGALLAAILFGDVSGLPAEDVELFQRIGLAHVFSVSGLHLSYVLALGLLLARMLRLRGVCHFVLNLIIMFFYCAMVGFPPATMRSFFMAAFSLGAYLQRRNSNPMQGLALAGMFLLLGNPQLLFAAGFQFSFAATWGIVYLYPRLQSRAAGWPRWGQWLLLPLSAQMGILPLVAYHFNMVSLVSVVTNLVLLGLLGAIVIVGLICIPLVWLAPLPGEYLLLGTGALAELAGLLTRLFAAIPGGVWYVGTPPVWLLLLYYALTAAWAEGLWDRARLDWMRSRRVAGVLAAGIIVLLMFKSLSSQPLRVVFLDVGQGDSILVTTPRGRNLLIDGGGRPEGFGSFDVGSRVVLPYLRREGISRIDLLVNTHPHEDHINGLLPVMREMPVEEAVISASSADNPKSGVLLDLCEARGIRCTEVERGYCFELEPGLSMEVLHPTGAAPAALTDADENNCSLVLRLVYRNTSFLLTGDVEREGMEEMLSAGVDFRSQVFKIPHHGSAYGLEKEFLERVEPEMGVISVGSNRFGHPAPEVLHYWEERNVPVFRTDMNGAVIITSDGERLEVRSQLEGSLIKY